MSKQDMIVEIKKVLGSDTPSMTFMPEEKVKALYDEHVVAGRNNDREVNGNRKSPFHVLNDEEISILLEEAESIGIDTTVLRFNYDKVKGTSYIDALDEIAVKGNVLPDDYSGSKHPRDIMSSRAVLAHEYYGHRRHKDNPYPQGSWEDEYRASRIAAEITPNLTDEERRHLVLDALSRKEEAGVEHEKDEFERRILYGY